MNARDCLRDPIPQIAEAANMLGRAVTAHLAGDTGLADSLIRGADMPEIRGWTESLWGKGSPYVKVRKVDGAPPRLAKEERVDARMPTSGEKAQLHARDGFRCRFCGIPVIRREIRARIAVAYPDALPWGRTNGTQHAAFQAMWAQYDHLLPHARGGTNKLDNMVVTCAPCNFARMNYTVEEVGLNDPRARDPAISGWDGLERFR